MPASPAAEPETLPIHTRGLTKRYGATVALDGLDLDVRAGEVYGFLSPNGAGKTTTIRLLLGLHCPSAGEAELFGLDAFARPVAAHRRLACVSGEPGLWPALTGEETFELLGALHQGTDVAYRRELIDQTVFLSSHILSEVEALCDRVGILRGGRLIDEGTLSELRHLVAQIVEVGFATEVPSLPELDGVKAQVTGRQTVRFEVWGPIAPLIDALGGLSVVSLLSREPSLEEIFVHYHQLAGDHVVA